MSSNRRICSAAKAVAILVTTPALAGCAYHPEGNVLAGHWGGDQASLAIDPDGRANIRMGCASADFDGPVKLDVGGHWLRDGTFTQGSGAPPPVPPSPVPAMIGGRLDRDGTLWLSIATSDGQRLDNAKLYRNRQPGFALCS